MAKLDARNAVLDSRNPYIPKPTQYDHPDLAEHRALLRSAPRLAWYYVRLFDAERPRAIPESGSEVMLIAWRIYRRGYTAPPIWLRHEWTQEKLRSWARAATPPSRGAPPGDTDTGGDAGWRSRGRGA
jgi:hypothetical protein